MQSRLSIQVLLFGKCVFLRMSAGLKPFVFSSWSRSFPLLKGLSEFKGEFLGFVGGVQPVITLFSWRDNLLFCEEVLGWGEIWLQNGRHLRGFSRLIIEELLFELTLPVIFQWLFCRGGLHYWVGIPRHLIEVVIPGRLCPVFLLFLLPFLVPLPLGRHCRSVLFPLVGNIFKGFIVFTAWAAQCWWRYPLSLTLLLASLRPYIARKSFLLARKTAAGSLRAETVSECLRRSYGATILLFQIAVICVMLLSALGAVNSQGVVTVWHATGFLITSPSSFDTCFIACAEGSEHFVEFLGVVTFNKEFFPWPLNCESGQSVWIYFHQQI